MPNQSMYPQRREAITDKVVAQPQDWGIQAPAPDHELTGLVRGLSELNPALKNYENESLMADHVALEKQKAGISALAQQQSDAIDMQGKRSIEFAGNPTPAQVPLALGTYYRDAFHKALGEREGIMSKDATMGAYNEAKDKPGFNVDAFLGESRANALKGLEGVPVLAAQVGNQVNTAEVQIRQDAQRMALLKHTETRNATVAQSFADALRPDLTPGDLFAAYTTQLLPAAEALGMSKKEGAQFLLSQLTKVSERMGGNPAVFDVMDQKDTEGMSLASRNPELANNIEAARSHARTRAEGKLRDDSQERNFITMTKLDAMMKSDPTSITLDVIRSNMGKAAPFATHDEAFAYWQRAQKAAEENRGTQLLQGMYESRQLWRLDAGDQKKVLEANLGPYAAKMAEAALKGDVPLVTTLAERIMLAQGSVGAKVPLEALANFIGTTVTSLPGKVPSPAFKAAAAIYQAYSSDPAFRDIYFKGDVAEVMKAYTAGEGSGDPQAAYLAAYHSVSLETKAAAARLIESPEWKKKSTDLVKSVQGSSFWPQWLGGNGRPEDADRIATVAGFAVKEWHARNPNSTDADALQFAKQWTAANFVQDTNTRTSIKIPPNFAGQGTQEALSAYSKRIGDEARAKLAEADRDDWKVNFVPVGDLGKFEVFLQNGSAMKHIGTKSLQEMRAENVLSTATTQEHKDAIGKVMLDLRNGKVDPAFVNANADAIALGTRFKVFLPSQLARLNEMKATEMMARVKAIPIMALGSADSSQLQFISQRGAKVDNKLTAQTASSFMTQAVGSVGSVGSSLAGSLITMAEGTVLQAYPDPAKDAGNNIGMGYNLKANAKNAPADLVRAGVPEERVQDVIAGKAQLTQDQARRLLLVAMPKYEETARRGAESEQTGLWNKMTPNQQAVMTDIAYSVGNADQFTKAWKAVASGDAEAFKAAVMTTYVNKDGVRVNDTRRFNLRAAMLSGTPNWNAVVQKYSGFPSNQLDSLALKGQ